MEDRAQLRPRRRLTQAEAREQTRRQLLAAAAQVFARKGFGGASLEEIAEVAGYTTGAIYYHFPSKDELFLELIREGWSRQIRNRVGAVTRMFEESSEDPFQALSRALVEQVARERELAPLSGEFWVYALRHPEAMAMVAEMLQEEVSGIAPAVGRAMAAREAATGISAEEMATIALVLFEGLARRRRLDPQAVPDDLLGRALRRLFGDPGAR